MFAHSPVDRITAKNSVQSRTEGTEEKNYTISSMTTISCSGIERLCSTFELMWSRVCEDPYRYYIEPNMEQSLFCQNDDCIASEVKPTKEQRTVFL